VDSQNRALKYGDGLFETIKVIAAQPVFLEDHYERLSKGLDTLRLHKRPFTLADFKNIINNHIRIKGVTNARVRITFFRRVGGLYTPQEHEFDYIVESSPLKSAKYQLQPQGLQLGVCSEVRLAIDALSNLKTTAALPYVLAGIQKKENNWDDALILNAEGYLAESIAANIFLVRGQKICTPTLDQGCVSGVMRKQLLGLMQGTDYQLEEKKISFSELEEAEELWLTNVIRGIRWVRGVRGVKKSYNQEVAAFFTNVLNQSIGLT